jgi:hypothetical protein
MKYGTTSTLCSSLVCFLGYSTWVLLVLEIDNEFSVLLVEHFEFWSGYTNLKFCSELSKGCGFRSSWDSNVGKLLCFG